MMKGEMKHGTSQTRTPRSEEKHDSIGKFTVQCANCFKWRLIPTQEEYESIRAHFVESPWVCTNKSDVSCDDPSDLEIDNTRTWVIDKPNLPKSPAGFRRGLSMRRDYSKMDAFYITPTGKKVRAPAEVEKFLESNPKYKDGVAVSDFVFTCPKIMAHTIPENVEKSSNKKMKLIKD